MLRQQYREALDEISVLMERVKKLESQLDNATRPQYIVPVGVELKDSTTFEKQVLSMGMYGAIESGPTDLASMKIQTKFTGHDMHGEKLDFLSKFPPLILEDVRHRLQKALEEIDNISAYIGRVDSAPSVHGLKGPAQQQKGKKKHSGSSAGKHQQQPNFDFVSILCCTKERNFPKLEHGFNMELLCVMLPSYKKGKKANFVLAIGNRESPVHDVEQDPHKEREVLYTIRMLAHDYAMLHGHACNVHRRNYPDKDVENPLRHVEWHHLMGLIPDARMYEATRPHALFLFPEQVLLHQPVPWPEPTQMVDYPGLNPIQAKVVQSLAHTTARGMFHLIGPPGTGKTTTITQLLLERVRKFPREKILLTAPSNKAIQVVLKRLVDSNNKNEHAVSIAVIGNTKLALPEHEALYASSFADSFITRFKKLRRPYHNVNAVFVVKRELQDLAQDIAKRISHLLTSPGRPVGFDEDSDDNSYDDNEQQTVDTLYALQEKFRTESIQHLWEEEPLHKYISGCISRLCQAAADIESYILRKAHVVFGTLVASGRKSLLRIVKSFDTVIVDEASQALMPATFIPFLYNPARYLLVGDPQQLPATVQADHLRPLGYADSLMLVMQREMGERSSAMMLTTQYRMHPAICKPISDLFYGGKLTTDNSVVNRQCLLKKHIPQQMLLHTLPSAFVDLDSVECRIGDGSTYNTDEAELVVTVVLYLLAQGVQPAQIGVVSGYAAQVALLKSLLVKEERLRPSRIDLTKLAVSTVDGFQGDEKDFMLFSCMRTGTSVGFLSDARRINVAMSRGRHANWVFGQARTLSDARSSIRDFLNWSTDHGRNCSAPFTRTIKAEELLKSMETPRVPPSVPPPLPPRVALSAPSPAPVLVAPVAHLVRENSGLDVPLPSAFARATAENAGTARRQEPLPVRPAEPEPQHNHRRQEGRDHVQDHQEFRYQHYERHEHQQHRRDQEHDNQERRYQQQHRPQREQPLHLQDRHHQQPRQQYQYQYRQPPQPREQRAPPPRHHSRQEEEHSELQSESRSRGAPPLRAPRPSRVTYQVAADAIDDGPTICLQDPILTAAARKPPRNETPAVPRNNNNKKRSANHLEAQEPRSNKKRSHVVYQESYY